MQGPLLSLDHPAGGTRVRAETVTYGVDPTTHSRIGGTARRVVAAPVVALSQVTKAIAERNLAHPGEPWSAGNIVHICDRFLPREAKGNADWLSLVFAWRTRCGRS